MKLLLDENISWKIKSLLMPYFDDVIHVNDISVSRMTDQMIWNYAKENEYIILTFDSDFQFLSTLYGSPPKVIWLRIGNSSKAAIAKFIISKIDILREFSEDHNIEILELL